MNTSNKNNSCTQAYFFFLSLLILTLQKRQFPYLLSLVVQRNSVDIHTNIYKMWHTNIKTYTTYQCMTKLCLLTWKKLLWRTNLSISTYILGYGKLLSLTTSTKFDNITKYNTTESNLSNWRSNLEFGKALSNNLSNTQTVSNNIQHVVHV